MLRANSAHNYITVILHRYDTMLACWKMDPTEMPAFSQLVVSLSCILDQLAGYFDLNAKHHESCTVNEEEEQKESSSLIDVEDQNGQQSETVSLPATPLQCDPSEVVDNQTFVTSAINLQTEDERYVSTPVSGKDREKTNN